MSIIFLKTDLLFYILITVVAAYAFFVFRTEHLRDTWRKVIRRPLAVSAGIILAFYVFVAFLDSIHIISRDLQSKQSSELVSVLDLVLWDLKTNVEKTYSAPLAYRSFSKETIYLKNGESVREFPRLLHGGVHLKDPETNYLDDLIELSLKGLSLGVLFWSILVGISVVLISLYRRNFRCVVKTIIVGGSEIPWKTVLLTSAVLATTDNYSFYHTSKVPPIQRN
jgi:peptide/nickel transport system permease protein